MTTVNAHASARQLYAAARRCFKPGTGPEDFRHGLELMKGAAAQGHAKAHSWLGALYYYGLGTRPNRPKSLAHYRIAAKAGEPNAEYHVGIFYYEGTAVPRDYRAAIRWLRKAAAHGDDTAVYWLGQCYLHGRGVSKNEVKGFELELRAANRRVVEAQYSVAVCYEHGQGVPADAKKAFRWYLVAARNLWVTAGVSEPPRPGTGGTSCRWSRRISADLRLRDRGVVLRRSRSSEGELGPRPSFSKKDRCGDHG